MNVKTALIILLILLKLSFLHAQTDTEPYTKQFQELKPFVNSYLSAYSHDFSANAGHSLNQGWSSGLGVGKAGSLKVSLIASSAFIPNSGGYISQDQLSYGSNIEVTGKGSTLFGGSSTGKASFYLLDPATGSRLVDPENNENIKGEFDLPDGVGTDVGLTPFLVPEVEVGVGFGTSVAVRFLPLSVGVNKGKVNISAFGFAIKHELLRYIQGLIGSPLQLNVFASYMHDKIKYKPSNGDLIEISGNYFNSKSNSDPLSLAHQSNAFQALIAGSYKISPFMTATAQTGASYQKSRLDTHGNLTINITTTLVSDTEVSTQVLDLVHVQVHSWTPQIGAGLLMGSGPFQTSLQYAYVNTHVVAIGLHYRVNAWL